ncbi:MAG: autotransporter domain-containing protein, partial [Devosia sp.]
TCGCMSSAVAITSSANIVAPHGILGSTTGAATLNLTAGTITGTQGVTLTASTIAATIAAGAKVAVNGTGAGRYGLKFDGTSNVTIAGAIDAPGADALLFTGGNATLTLLPGFVIAGQVDALDTATNDLIFGGTTGGASFDLDRLGTDITDFDTFHKTGNSTWTFSGANFSGLLTANAGTVVINSAIPSLDLVLENATLHGNAGLKSLTISGGTLAPGNSIGTVTVAGNATIGANTVYEVEVNAAGASDKLVAGGTATIDPTASVLASMEPGSFGAFTQYAIITAAGGVSGAFSGVNSVSAFYDAALSYDANNAYLTLTRNALTLGDFAGTPNQIATAAALDGGGQGVPYFDELFVLPAGEVPGALDAISGDGYASLTAAALDNGRFVRDAALDRRGARGIWTTPYGGLSHLPGDGNGPGVDHATGGLLLGADGEVGDGYLGVLLGYGQTSYAIPSRDMTASSGEFSLGAYGGVDWDGFYASFGSTITARDIDATRRVVFPNVDDTFTAQYASLTAQAFTELGFRLEMGGTTITPFGGLAGLQSATSGYTEAGTGAGALTVDPSVASALVATLGVRLEHEIALNDDTTLTLRGSAAWRHAMGKASTTNSMAGTSTFTVAGAPLAADTLTVSAGTALDMGQLSLGLDYTGSFGSGGVANAARATLAGQF